jgi:aminopeptidase N
MTGMARVPRLPAAVAAVVLAVTTAAAPTPLSPVAHAASPVGIGQIVAGTVGRSSLDLDAVYRSTLKLTWSTRAIWVDSTAIITNSSGAEIDRVELNTIAARIGNIRLRPVTVDGVAVPATVTGQTIIVPLGGILPVDATTRVRVRFSARLNDDVAGSHWLFTQTGGIADIYRWLPWVSRRVTFERPSHADPFVTPTSRDVRVTITSDRRLDLATTGELVSTSPDGRTSTFQATNVRDFTVTASTNFEWRERRVGDTTIRVWYRPGTRGAAWLDAAADAFAALESRLGPYGYPTFDVVQSAGGSGMESPGLIWIPTGTAATNVRYLAAHETAHLWFYGIVGSDQVREPFTDEAMADFAARSILGIHRSSQCPTRPLDRSIYDYTARCYYEIVYIQGGNLLEDALRAMGTDLFWATIRGYVEANRYELVSTATLLSTLDDATPLDLAGLLFAARFPRIY